MDTAPLVVVMGVSGSGKSTLGALLARRLQVPFCEGDALHPAANVALMRAGAPLDDQNREPWLTRINEWLRSHTQSGGVAACSALKRRYRDHLREGLPSALVFLLLDPQREELKRRLAVRRSHFMSPSLLDSQLATLERPTPDECAVVVPSCSAPEEIVSELVARLASQSTRGARCG